jgi:putative ABC transport system permease protein
MIRSYIKTAFRSLKKNKGFTILNVLGLSVGLATCLLIIFYVVNEFSYDRYNTNADRIYRISEDAKLNGNQIISAATEAPLLGVLKSSFPEIEKTARIIPTSALYSSRQKYYIRKGDNNIQEKNVVFAESGLFDVFTLPMIDGNPSTSLSEPNSAVITESTAIKYFNSTHVVGQTLMVNDSNAYKITGVIKDIPAQSHFNYDFFLSFSSLPESHSNNWYFSGIHNYILLKPGTDIRKLESAIQQIELKNYPPVITKNGNYLKIALTPLLDIHLHSAAQYELTENGNIEYVYIFSIIAIFILLIACVNFMNLSTARSSNRAKEVGVRKVLGSPRKHLIAQFLTESMLVTLLSTIIALVLAWLAMPFFNHMADKHLAFTLSSVTWLAPLLVVIVLVIGFVAGSYPAFYLSAFQPIKVLQGKIAAGFKGGIFRNSLVVFQFSISIFLIIGTIVINNQLKYIHTKSLGYTRSQMLVIKNVNTLGKQANILKQEIKQMPGVVNATMSTYLPTGDDRNATGLFSALPIDIKQDVLTEFWPADEDYLNTLGIKLVSGRNFSAQMASDTAALIVNEAFVKAFGQKDPLNKTVYRTSYGIQAFHIVGVMKDFNFSSLRDQIKPVVLVYNEDRGSITARVSTANLPALMSQIGDKWKDVSPNQRFSYSFMDQDFDALYNTEQRTGTIFMAFTTLAIIIACLGLFGLAAYAAEQRTKEIGIRKVLGASMATITQMLSMDFIRLVIISIAIASPIAWWAMNKWLQDFAYRVQIQWWVIAIAGAASIIIALITISFQSIKAAIANPVKSLRSE